MSKHDRTPEGVLNHPPHGQDTDDRSGRAQRTVIEQEGEQPAAESVRRHVDKTEHERPQGEYGPQGEHGSR